MKFTPDQIARYFEARFPGYRFTGKMQQMVRCLWHEDRTASLSINVGDGVFRCHAGCAQGGIYDFEQKFSGCDRDVARANVAELMGIEQAFLHQQQPISVYPYRDAHSRLVAEKLRYANGPDGRKDFRWRVPKSGGKFEYRLNGIKPPLYRLPELIRSNFAIIVEGEKDADNTLRALAHVQHLSVTTSPDGASTDSQSPKWSPSFSPYFAGKIVAILPDNDDCGRAHALAIANAIYPYAAGVKIVHLPGLPEKGDVSDYLEKHPGEELLALIKNAPGWKPSKPQRQLLVDAVSFAAQRPAEIDWIVEGVLERGANGFVVANPKVGKSFAAIDLAVSLALGSPWLEFRIPAPVKTALISREDNPALTAWRLKHIFLGKQCSSPDLLKNLYVNSREQSAELLLDNAGQMDELSAELKRRATEFVIFDVFNILHSAEENDSGEMRKIMLRLSQLQSEVGCSIGVIHHFSKGTDGMSLTQRLRGSSAISGWCEWLIGITMAELQTKTRKMEFEIKAAAAPDPIHFNIISGDSVRLERNTCFVPNQSQKNGSKYMQ